jgi:FMN phosphatase YigB (HAD superfamily)
VRRGYRLGLIFNTLYTRGEVLRQALRRLGLHNAVQVLVFSDEVGIHVDDIDELDVGGAPLAVRSRK